MAKRIIITVLALCLAVSMAACGLTKTIEEGVGEALNQLGGAIQFTPGAKLLQEEMDEINADANGVQTVTHSVNRFEYDENGNQMLVETTATDENGKTVTTRQESKFDAQGQQIENKTVEADGSTFLTVYTNDENGRAKEIKEEDSNGFSSTRTYEYDDKGNEIRSTYTASDGTSTETVTAYNESGYATHAEVTGKNADGSDAGSVSDYEYDAENRMLKSSCKSADGTEETSAYEYDANGNVTKDIYVSGSTRTEKVSTYDASGNEIETLVTDQDGKTYRTTREYDANGNCVKTEYDDEYKTTYVYLYDAEGREVYNRCDVWYPDQEPAHTSTVTITSYDAMGNETSSNTYCSDGSGYGSTNTYDPFGNLLRSSYTNIGSDGSSQTAVKSCTYEEVKTEGKAGG